MSFRIIFCFLYKLQQANSRKQQENRRIENTVNFGWCLCGFGYSVEKLVIIILKLKNMLWIVSIIAWKAIICWTHVRAPCITTIHCGYSVQIILLNQQTQIIQMASILCYNFVSHFFIINTFYSSPVGLNWDVFYPILPSTLLL